MARRSCIHLCACTAEKKSTVKSSCIRLDVFAQMLTFQTFRRNGGAERTKPPLRQNARID